MLQRLMEINIRRGTVFQVESYFYFDVVTMKISSESFVPVPSIWTNSVDGICKVIANYFLKSCLLSGSSLSCFSLRETVKMEFCFSVSVVHTS